MMTFLALLLGLGATVCAVAVAEVVYLRRAQRLRDLQQQHMVQVGAACRPRGCQHKTIPHPVMSGSDLVAWLCGDCMEERKSFTCPVSGSRHNPIVLCRHEETEEIRTLDSRIVRLYCRHCGQTEMFVDLPMATYTKGQKPVTLL